MKKAQIEEIQSQVNLLKNKIIKFLLPLANTSHTERQAIPFVIPKPLTYAETVKSDVGVKRPKATTVILQTGLETKPEVKTVMNIEKSVANILNKNKISATLLAAHPNTNGNIIMKFDQKDNVSEIAKTIEKDLNMKAFGRKLLLPKIKISCIPSYISIDSDELKKEIVNSNFWLKSLIDGGETFDFELHF